MSIVGCTGSVPPAGPPPAPKVSVIRPESRELRNAIELNGWMQPDHVQEVRSRVRGHIKKVHFTDGDIVKKSDLLFEIDPRPFQTALDAARAQVKSADAQLELANSELNRTTGLVRKGASTREELEVKVAQQKVAAADKAKAQSAVDQANLDLEYSRITADIGGRIGKAELTEGNLVNAGGSDPLLATIVSTDPIRIYFSVDERSLQQYARSVNAAGKNVTELLAALKDAKVDFTFRLEGENDFKHSARLAFSDNRSTRPRAPFSSMGPCPTRTAFSSPGPVCACGCPWPSPIRRYWCPRRQSWPTRTSAMSSSPMKRTWPAGATSRWGR